MYVYEVGSKQPLRRPGLSASHVTLSSEADGPAKEDTPGSIGSSSSTVGTAACSPLTGMLVERDVFTVIMDEFVAKIARPVGDQFPPNELQHFALALHMILPQFLVTLLPSYIQVCNRFSMRIIYIITFCLSGFELTSGFEFYYLTCPNPIVHTVLCMHSQGTFVSW